MKRSVYLAFALLLAGLMLAGAAVDPGLPVGYWDKPQASAIKVPHDWSALESDLHPESCAQCHSEQFDSWKKSLHAHAYSPGLIGQFPGMGHDEANSCLQCHAPLKEQLYQNTKQMNDSIALKLAHAEGFDVNGELDGEIEALPLAHSGVSCAVCHVRGGQRFGPPAKSSGAVGFQGSPVHGGFTATRAFEDAQFCASCHQFPESMSINGKPLENTLNEWKESSFSEGGVTCQQCHMPDRKHEFRGIHDSEMVRKGLEFKLFQQGDAVVLTMHSIWIGHAFPSYVTPKVEVIAQALNAQGETVQQRQWQIIREVEYDNGWQEKRDTRLDPGETRMFKLTDIPEHTKTVRYRVIVEPDYFYKGVYKSLLSGEMGAQARLHIQQASRQAAGNDFVLFENTIALE